MNTTTVLSVQPLTWLPVLSKIAPPHVHCRNADVNLLDRLKDNFTVPVHFDIFYPPIAQLPSRRRGIVHPFKTL